MPSQEVLLAIARRLSAAGDAHDRQPNTAAEAVIKARLELQEAFIRAGWMPPRYRQEEMQRDRQIVSAPAGMFEDSQEVAAAIPHQE